MKTNDDQSIGYARISDGQTRNPQIGASSTACCAFVFEESGVSGGTTVCEGPDACLATLRSGNTLVVTRLDRRDRSLPHLVSTVYELASRGVGFRSLAEAIDTGKATVGLVVGIFASLAAFERDLISERTIAALAAKKRRGKLVGRQPAITPAHVREAHAMLAADRGPSYVARASCAGVDALPAHRTYLVSQPTPQKPRVACMPGKFPTLCSCKTSFLLMTELPF